MATFPTITSRVVPLLVDNIDTDQIIPARFLKAMDKEGLGEKLFADWRYEFNGSPKGDFPLNDPALHHAKILLAGNNFGCGSSREHAPWALVSYGFRAVISTSFADIFRSNALKNGLLPVVVSADNHRQLVRELQQTRDADASVDLEKQQVIFPSGMVVSFPIDPFSKYCLLNGIDELEYLRQFAQEIDEYQATRVYW